ncbi:MAG: carbamoyltransferase HypF [Lachnospiraceae bacterium]|nr:carbamoyltransferase HypF [Lachnospiraceae bacterium]
MVTKRIRVYGIVQGVGFRPTVSRYAAAAGISGSVANRGSYVEILAQGGEEALSSFLKNLEEEPPKRAVILKMEARELSDAPLYSDFQIIESEKTAGEIFISPDIAICEDCRRELFDPKDRRYLHPFINCTSCGPRMTILDALPYDRERTSMKEFPMCPACAAEYHDPGSRRYDAQPVACHSCGPVYYLLGRKERGHEAIAKTRKVIREGGVAAVKGIGGFHLVCDAENPAAVELLRRRKNRPMKPFAVMARDLAAAERECFVSPEAAEILDGHQKPILLLQKRGEGRVAEAAAPDNPNLGILLPYAPIHLLLFSYDDGLSMPDYLIVTSGNISGAPICRDDAEAEEELGGLCDVILSHNRRIRIRADDTVMALYEGAPYMIRRSRGYAPLPIRLPERFDAPVLAMGGELKNSFCIGKGGMFYLSPYIGDLTDLRTEEALRETIGRFSGLLEAEPEMVAADLHPRYRSLALAEETGLPLIGIQHHYAHILSCMAENECAERVVGLSFDGSGYGTDGTVWGGEILLADYAGFERKARMEPFLLAGGDAAAREGWRAAVAMLYGLYKDRDRVLALSESLGLAGPVKAGTILGMAERGVNCVSCSSMGRLFDAVSAVLGLRLSSTFEGEASMALEFAAEEYAERREPGRAGCSFSLKGREGEKAGLSFAEEEEMGGSGLSSAEKKERGAAGVSCAEPGGTGEAGASSTEMSDLPTSQLFHAIVRRRLAGEETGKLAFIFHEELAELAAEAAAKIGEAAGVRIAALSGGCFQNRLLLELTEKKLKKAGFYVLRHRLLPPNDGGIALGQAAAAAYRSRAK